jgi:chromosome segregation ATPase
MSAVEKLRPKQDATSEMQQVPALGFSVQVDLGAGRAAVFQSAVAGDCDIAELNTVLDKINRAGDRQRAHYKIEEELHKLEQIEQEQRQHTEDLQEVDQRYAEEQKQLRADVLKAEKARGNFYTAHQADHEARGRRGAYEPKGIERTQVNSLTKGIEQLEEDIAKATAEHDKTHMQFNDLKRRRAEVIAKHRKEIERCREIVLV